MIHKPTVIISGLLVLLAALPAYFLLAETPQDTRSKAAASTSLYFSPSTNGDTPIQKLNDEVVAFDVMIDPGTNMASMVKLEINYDAEYFTPASTPFTVNSAVFPTTIEGPVLLSGKVLVSVSIGSDSTKAVNKISKVGTLYLKTKANPTVYGPTEISFGTKSQILSVGQYDQSTENVLATTQPAYVAIALPPTAVPTSTPEPTAVPTLIPTLTLTPTPTIIVPTATPVATAIPQPLTSTLSFTVGLHGIGTIGDNANLYASDYSNKSPLHTQKNIEVKIYDDQNNLTTTKQGTIEYNNVEGVYMGTVELGTDVPEGDYTVRIKDQTHLGKIIPGIHRIVPEQTNTMPAVALVAGDINGDNTLNILDYNILVGCYSDLLPAVDCDATRKLKSDVNDNGDVNQFDYNLFLREITVQTGN